MKRGGTGWWGEGGQCEICAGRVLHLPSFCLLNTKKRGGGRQTGKLKKLARDRAKEIQKNKKKKIDGRRRTEGRLQKADRHKSEWQGDRPTGKRRRKKKQGTERQKKKVGQTNEEKGDAGQTVGQTDRREGRSRTDCRTDRQKRR